MSEPLTEKQQQVSLTDRINNNESTLTVAVSTLLSISISTGANALFEKPDQQNWRLAITSMAPAIGLIFTYVLLYFAIRYKKNDIHAYNTKFYDKEIELCHKRLNTYMIEYDTASLDKKKILEDLIRAEREEIKKCMADKHAFFNQNNTIHGIDSPKKNQG